MEFTIQINHIQSISFLHIKIDDDKFDSDLIQRCHTTKLQIVIICPLLINLEFGMVKSRLSQILKSDRTIGMLLDVKEVQMLDIHRDSKFYSTLVISFCYKLTLLCSLTQSFHHITNGGSV